MVKDVTRVWAEAAPTTSNDIRSAMHFLVREFLKIEKNSFIELHLRLSF